MVWFRVDDVLPFHARVIEAGNAAMGLWVRAGALSAGQLTDGFITTATARSLGSTREIKRLVDVGLWNEVDGGYQFHAWAEDGTGTKRQPTRAEVEAQRRAERDRKAAYRASRRDTDGGPGPVPPGVPAGHPQGHPADVRPESQQASGHPVPSRPVPTHDSYVSQSSHLPERESYPQATDDEASRQRRNAYWRGWGIPNPLKVLSTLHQAVDRPVTEDQAIEIVAGILSKAKQRPTNLERYVLASIRQSWAEIQQQLDEAAVAA
jgi:hypothetical protein